MGSYVKGILGNFTGKVGTVIGSNWKSINYMKSLPGKRKGMPSSDKVEQQLKFALMLRFHEAFQSLLTLTFANSFKPFKAFKYLKSFKSTILNVLNLSNLKYVSGQCFEEIEVYIIFPFRLHPLLNLFYRLI